jgi:hypothetical protein
MRPIARLFSYWREAYWRIVIVASHCSQHCNDTTHLRVDDKTSHLSLHRQLHRVASDQQTSETKTHRASRIPRQLSASANLLRNIWFEKHHPPHRLLHPTNHATPNLTLARIKIIKTPASDMPPKRAAAASKAAAKDAPATTAAAKNKANTAAKVTKPEPATKKTTAKSKAAETAKPAAKGRGRPKKQPEPEPEVESELESEAESGSEADSEEEKVEAETKPKATKTKTNGKLISLVLQ